jgi:acyl-coenzyme A thioesterase PaaI-like protein
MTNTTASRPLTSALVSWARITALPLGKWLFSRVVCFKAPYFTGISPRFVDLRHGFCEVTMKKRRAVQNHIGTVHAIAMCNLAELAAGTMTEATVPATHRWIPKGMTVEYLKKAGTDLRAVAKLDPVPNFGAPADVPVPVSVTDTTGAEVFRAVIVMHISPRKASV